MKQNLLLLFALCGISYTHAQDNKGLIINEIMQSNVETYMYDDLNEIPDSWVELYNNSNEAVNLKDYQISIDKEDKAWQLPDMTVGKNQYVIIYCDKEGLVNNRLHTDFRLESGKDGNIYLFKGDQVIDQIEKLAKMPAPDVSYGRKNDGADEWGYQLTPTPGKANTGNICDAKHILGAPVFSVPGHFTTGNGTISLELSLPDKTPDGAVIFYTTNGSEPTNTESTSNKKYTQAIEIKKSTVIRAKIFCNGYLSPKSTAQSYIFHPRNSLPVVSFVTDDDYLWDKNIGLFENNNNKDDKKTHDWRRPMNIEYFPAEGEASAFNQIGEFRIQGGQSRENALQSMALYANKRFGTNRFNYEFFPAQKPGIKEFKSISLRDGGNDFTDLFFRDAIIQNTMGQHVDLDWQACKTTVIYINGEYRGILNFRERSNEDNIYSNYQTTKGKGLEDLDMIEISHEKDANQKDLFIEELKEGTIDNYNAFKTFYSQEGHTKAEYEEWLDVSEYLNVMVMNLFYGNIDFPGNNTVFWRPNKDNTDLPKRWRVIIKDTDFGLGLYNRQNSYNTIDLIYNPNNHQGDAWACTEPATRLFKNMMKNEDLRQLFIDKSCVYMGDFMNAKGTGEVIDSIKNEVIDEFVEHRKLRGQRSKQSKSYGGGSRQELIQKFENAKKWLSEGSNNWGPWGGGGSKSRPDYFLEHMSTQWKLGTATAVTVNKNTNEVPSTVAINGIELTKGVFDGKLFPNRQYTITATAPEGQVVKGWKVTKNNQTTTVNNSEYTFTLAQNTPLAIEAILGVDTGIDTATALSWKWQRTEGGINVSNVPEGQKVSIYDLRGMLKSEAISNGSDIFLPAAAGQLYILKVGSESVKIK